MGWQFPGCRRTAATSTATSASASRRRSAPRATVDYNYHRMPFPAEEAPGISVFYKDDAGDVFHTYSTYGRGVEVMMGTYNLLDLVPKGRDERDVAYKMEWVRHHDRYEPEPEAKRDGARAAPRTTESAAGPVTGCSAMESLWPWLAVAGLGALHGLNPASGWMLAVGMRRRQRRRAQSAPRVAAGRRRPRRRDHGRRRRVRRRRGDRPRRGARPRRHRARRHGGLALAAKHRRAGIAGRAMPQQRVRHRGRLFPAWPPRTGPGRCGSRRSRRCA